MYSLTDVRAVQYGSFFVDVAAWNESIRVQLFKNRYTKEIFSFQCIENIYKKRSAKAKCTSHFSL